MHMCAHTHIHTELYQGQYLSSDTEDVNIGGLALGDHAIHFLANSCESIIISKCKKKKVQFGPEFLKC